MADNETGSWWQQVTGEAIHGPMKGKRLKPVLMDEVSFGIWKAENPNGRVLQADPKFASQYEKADWESSYAKFPVVTQRDAKDILKPRDLIVGISINGKDRAYPTESLKQQKGVLDEVGGTPIFIVAADDGKSIRVFDRRIEDKTLELFVKEGEALLVDAQSGSKWNFSGLCVEGSSKGKQLKQLPMLKDYWFDWKGYHPGTTIYTPGMRAN